MATTAVSITTAMSRDRTGPHDGPHQEPHDGRHHDNEVVFGMSDQGGDRG